MLKNRLFQGVLTSVVWALAVGSAVYWALSMPGADAHGASANVATNALVADAQGMQRLFGAAHTPAVTAVKTPNGTTKMALLGVVAGTRSGQGAALISLNDQPARTVRVGHQLPGNDGLYLQSLQGRVAYLGPDVAGQSTVELMLPEYQANTASAVGAARNTANRAFGSQAVAPAPLRPSQGAN